MKTIKLSVYNLQTILGIVPRFHGNGFIQLYLSSNTRLHIWHPDLPPTVENAQIHNHRFDMKSYILRGTLRHRTYNATEASDSLFVLKHRKYACIGASTPEKFDADTLEQGERVEIIETGAYDLIAGSKYTLPKNSFHSSEGAGLTITLMKKSYQDETPAIVIGPADKAPDHAFNPDNQPRLGDLWEAVESAINALRNSEVDGLITVDGEVHVQV